MNAAGFVAASLISLAFLAPLGDQHAVALAASASALALLIAGLLRCAGKAVPLAGCAGTAHGSAVARSSSRDVVVLPQRDPDAAGKPRPRAPGSNPSTV